LPPPGGVEDSSVLYGTAVVPVTVRHDLFFNGRYRSDVAVQCYGLLGSQMSYETVFTQTVLQLIAHCEDVAVHDCRYKQSLTEGPFAEHTWVNPTAPVALFHATFNDSVVDALAGHPFKIIMSVCDTDAVAQKVVRICNKFDLLVVPSHYCRDTFSRSGVKTPILVIPHGIRPEFHPYPQSERPDTFTYYNVYNAGRAYRKSQDELVRSFVRAFDRDPRYRLRLRTTNSGRLRHSLDEERAHEIVWIDDETEAEYSHYAARYSEVHATVHPSKTEGFGMIPLESLACETPVIAPRITGMTDYLTPDNAMLLRTNGLVPEQEFSSTGGHMHGIDEGHLVECLRSMADDWETERARAIAAGSYIRQQYTWARVTEPLVELIQQQLRRPGSVKLS